MNRPALSILIIFLEIISVSNYAYAENSQKRVLVFSVHGEPSVLDVSTNVQDYRIGKLKCVTTESQITVCLSKQLLDKARSNSQFSEDKSASD